MCEKQDKKIKILVVDDDDMLREFLSRILTLNDYDSVCAPDGDSAIRILEKEGDSIKLAIIDLLMPIMTGWELIQYMKKDKSLKKIPVIVTTGLDDAENTEDIQSHCAAIICKSELNVKNFTSAVDAILRKKQS
jgi:DNA-binding response OmpR family regulator